MEFEYLASALAYFKIQYIHSISDQLVYEFNSQNICQIFYEDKASSVPRLTVSEIHKIFFQGLHPVTVANELKELFVELAHTIDKKIIKFQSAKSTNRDRFENKDLCDHRMTTWE
ncbi:hypothetical protein QAD02_022802 [Eretmocerus hayati]|uniref:Uncharacterized protein n=1 Tax=Eretmocerus hayati TaxID=131215 RepID=A0ACC2PU44_9HYME|nr:hypothetical protein QAD02_022802 [Eretmocerus hayati]